MQKETDISSLEVTMIQKMLTAFDKIRVRLPSSFEPHTSTILSSYQRCYLEQFVKFRISRSNEELYRKGKQHTSKTKGNSHDHSIAQASIFNLVGKLVPNVVMLGNCKTNH